MVGTDIVPVSGRQSASDLMSTLIDAADSTLREARERCPVIHSLCGWRGVRIGEASNPVPQSNNSSRKVIGSPF